MKSKVSIVRCSSYDENLVYESVKKSIALLGGLESFIKPKSRVLLKPNLLGPHPPESGITTHPAVVEALVRLLKDFDVDIYIGDSLSIGYVKTLSNYEKIFRVTGISEVAQRYGAKCIGFKETVLLPKKEKHMFKEISAAKEVLGMDAVINLPKFKTHAQTYLTLCVKNMFGCVVGLQKAQWHFLAGTDYIYFSRMLTELYDSLKPTLNILDGVMAMEGDGPNAGDLRNLGLIIASPDGVALDRVACEIIGGNPKLFFILEAANQIKCGETQLSNIDILGEDLCGIKVKDFKFPTFISMSKMGPEILNKHIRFLVTSKPKEVRKKCKLCGVCIDVCPVKAITKKDYRLHFDYDKCIRCFCCSELCPHQAMKIHRPIFYKIVKKL